ncbi:MAG TPA: ATP-binding protein [Chitinophagaceae bacterium]|nr:ATP-binding protein [Chitinophagaceae bacterium]
MEASKDVDIFFLIFVGTLVMIVLSVGIVTFFMVYQKRLLRKQAELHEIELKYKEELLHSNIEMLEQERKRIAKDLHDDIGNIFSTLTWKLQQLNTANNGTHEKILEDAKQLSTSGLMNIRNITYDMIPYGFEMFGLQAAIQNLCDRVSGTGLLEVELDCASQLPSLPEDMSLNIYRILQELTGNTIKYGSATRIFIDVSPSADAIRIRYEDNGCGFDMGSNKKRKGHGLRNIESRINMLKARYDFQTAPGKGVAVHILIPIKHLS